MESRVEELLHEILGDDAEIEESQSRVEELLYRILNRGGNEEVTNARTSITGTIYENLKTRLDSEYSVLANRDNDIHFVTQAEYDELVDKTGIYAIYES